MTPAFESYLTLERQMLAQDDEGAASRAKDAMNALWLKLTDEERTWLQERDRMRNR